MNIYKYKKLHCQELKSFADAQYLCSIIEATKLYFFGRICGHVNLDDFKGFILMVAVKNEYRDAIIQILGSPTTNMSSIKSKEFGNVLSVSSVLASQFIKRELNDRLPENSRYNRSQVTLFSWAAQDGHTAVVQLLLEHVGVNDRDRQMALQQAAANGRNEVVQFLVEKGANFDIKGIIVLTALHGAAANGHNEVAQFLVEKGANVDVTDAIGWTALHYAAYNGRSEIVRFLIEKRANVDVTDVNGWTALQLAAEGRHEEVVQLLTS